MCGGGCQRGRCVEGGVKEVGVWRGGRCVEGGVKEVGVWRGGSKR